MSSWKIHGAPEHELALRASLAALLDRRGVRAEPSPVGVTYDLALWEELCGSLGLGDLASAEPDDSSAPTGLMAACFEGLGERLAAVPAFSAFALTAPAVRACAGDLDDRIAGSWWPELLAGRLVATIALPDEYAVAAGGSGAPLTIRGTAPHTVDGATAQVVLVLAELPGQGACLLEIEDLSPDRVERRRESTFDLSRELARLTFHDAPARVVGRVDPVALRRALETYTTLLLAAEQLGGIGACLQLAVDHARTRFQFGRSIGSFQAVKHRLADMYLELELTRSAVMEACRAVDRAAPDATLWASIAHRTAASASTRIAAQALQIHGGLGFTWEHPIHLYLKRARSSQVLLDLPGERTARVVELLGL